MTDQEDPVFLSVVRVDADAFLRRHPDLAGDAPTAHVLRSVLIKPEAENYLDQLHSRVHRLAVGDDRPAGHHGDDTVDGDAVRSNGVPEAVPVRTAVRTTDADTDRLVELLTRSFHDDPLTVWAFPDPGRRGAILPEFFRAHVDLSLDYDGVYTTPERDAVLLFLPPGAWEKVAARDAELTELFADIAGEYREALLTIMERQARCHPGGRHYYVSFVGVDPDAQRRGTGAVLSDALVERADQEGVAVYTETSSAGGAGLTQRYGFAPLGADIVLPDGPSLRPMWRVPR